MIGELLRKRRLPEVLRNSVGSFCTNEDQWMLRRQEIRQLLCREFAGFQPVFPTVVECYVIKEEITFGGKSVTYELEIRSKSPFSYFSFPCTLTLPREVVKPAVFLYLSFTSAIADGLGEEILDHGFGIANVCYQDIAADREDDFQSGAGRFCSRNRFDSWGKLGMWAWGASRIMDYLQTLDFIDTGRIAIMGHSRLGKAALWCGALDERFSLVVSNDSGGGGAALFRGKTGERLSDLANKGSNCWFCGNLFQYVSREEELPFDQHYLLAMIAPRHLYVCSASLDDWADPVSEFLGCVAAAPVYELLGVRGLEVPDTLPKPGEHFHEGRIGYHLRPGTHYLSRNDWQLVMAYREKHRV
jgi:hypothetical protein